MSLLKPRRYRFHGRKKVHLATSGRLGLFKTACGLDVVHKGAMADKETKDEVSCRRCRIATRKALS